MARQYSVIPVSRTILADLETPVAAYLNLTEGDDQNYSYLLESVEGGETLGRYSFIGTQPYRVLRQRKGKVQEQRGRKWIDCAGSIVDIARAEVRRRRVALREGDPPFMAGAVGYFGYDMIRTLEQLPDHAKDDLKLDEALLMFFSRQLIFDHVRRQIVLVACVIVEAGVEREYERALKDLDRMERKLGRAPVLPHNRIEKGTLRTRPNWERRDYEKAVRRAKEYIEAGDAFQIVLSLRLEIKTSVAPFQLYRALRTINPSPYMFYLRVPDISVVGASPEMLVNVNGRDINYRPIAGTRPRGQNEEEDRRLEQELLSDEKERAEHIMLVDLGRNDVGRVAEFGTVNVPRLMFVEKYSHVQHLVTAVRGRLRQNCDMFDALMACFPAGTLSGAPKVRAMQIIDELEPTRRGIYAGSIMYMDFSGNLNSCIAIRTVVVSDGKAYVQAGAGIVADSDPAREFEECMNKAGALTRAIQMARQGL